MRSYSSLACLALVLRFAAADPTDWVNPAYVLSNSRGPANTSAAQHQILAAAGWTAKKGPWTVMNGSIVPPSGNLHDYLSWAPYQWPDCKWCPPKNAKRENFPDSSTDGPGHPVRRALSDGVPLIYGSDVAPTASLPHIVGAASAIPTIPYISNPLSQQAPVSSTAPPIASETINGAKAPVRSSSTHKSSAAPSATCTPSPTQSLAPSATWTTCPYVTKDGQRNPDVSLPQDSPSIVAMAQSVLYNSVAYALSASSSFSKVTASIIDTWFLNSATAMNPQMKYGQVVRGPGTQTGSFMGILDARGFVQVFNGIAILKLAQSPDWTTSRETALQRWVSVYDNWLVNSDLGRKSASSPNNHGTFWMNQMVVLKIYENDLSGARAAVKYYFTHQFLDQIVASGEQPFEAVRTRPFHYRCFNLQAMIINAKLADQLGLNMWIAKSRYGATIQTATNFLMATNPGSEDVTELYPHVASVAAAYGDPTGKYLAFLQQGDPNYASNPYWFYSQPAALRGASARNQQKRNDFPTGGVKERGIPTGYAVMKPAAFAESNVVELDEGVFVTWDDLKPYYGDRIGQQVIGMRGWRDRHVLSKSLGRTEGPARVLEWNW